MNAKELKKAFELEKKKFKEIEKVYHENMVESFIDLIREILTMPSYQGKKLGIKDIKAIGLAPKTSFVTLNIHLELYSEQNKEIQHTLKDIEPKHKHLFLGTTKNSILQKDMYDKFMSLFFDYLSQESININQAIYKKIMPNYESNPQYEFLIQKECLEESIKKSMGEKWYSEYEKKQIEKNLPLGQIDKENKKVKL
jgi:hypothetical protein